MKTVNWIYLIPRSLLRGSLLEGLYFKIEDDEKVIERFKFVRQTFSQTVEESGDHWLNRPVVPNQLRDGVDIFQNEL